MTEQEFDKLMKMNKRDLVMLIWELSNEVKQLRDVNSEQGWRLNPDRMGGQFTQEEINRRDEWR
jgi:hypothetical protein